MKMNGATITGWYLSQAGAVMNQTRRLNMALNKEDYQDFIDSGKGFLSELTSSIKRDGITIWDIDRYHELLGEPLRYSGEDEEEFEKRVATSLNRCPVSVNPSLWRQALLNHMHGLYRVSDRVYQIRGYDLANLTIVEVTGGIVVIDCTTACETAAAAIDLYRNYKKKEGGGDDGDACRTDGGPVKAIILTHTHVDHYGGIQGVINVDQGRQDSTPPVIIAPENFVEEAVLENAVVGDAMARRSTYQYGTFLSVKNDGTGKIDAGLGKDIQMGGTVSFAMPTHTVTVNPTPTVPVTAKYDESIPQTPLFDRQEYSLFGVRFEFLLCPNTEAPAEMVIWLPDDKVLVAAEIATHTLHNLLTPRGAEVRDARLWWKALDRMITLYGTRMEYICATHHWPTLDQNRCVPFLEQQRDSYKFLHDQTVHLINRGYTMLEIAACFDEPEFLPDLLKDSWHNRGYYGTISHDVRAIYQKYIGWYDMNPSNLNPLPPKQAAERYVKCMGGEDQVWVLLKHAVSEEDYRWAAELGKHLVFANPSEENRRLLAAVYEKLGEACEAGTWRNMYLVGAEELKKGGPLVSMNGSTANQSILQAMDKELFYDFAAGRLNGQRAGKCRMVFAITQEDSTEYVRVEHGVLNYHDKEEEGAVPFTISRETFADILLGVLTADEAIDNGKITLSNTMDEQEAVLSFFDLFDCAPPNFNIVQPKVRKH